MVELSGISVLIITCSTAVIGIISQIQHSRCTKLDVFCGLCSCTRAVPEADEPTVELKPNEEIRQSI